MYEVSVKAEFSSAHNLRGYSGKCERLHGHNWTVEAAVSSDRLDKNGLLVDFKILRRRLGKILEGLDHTNLNETPHFKKNNPTSENIARFVFDRLKKEGLSPSRVSVGESGSTCATYYVSRSAGQPVD